MASLKEGEWFCYRSGLFNGGGLVSLMEGEWSCYGGGQLKGERIIGTEVASLKEENGHYRGGQFNRGRMVMLQR